MRGKTCSAVDYYFPAGWTILVCLLALLGGSEAGPKFNYMVLLPAQLHHPFMERACLLLDGEVEKLKLSFKVTLESQGETIKLFTPEDHLLRGLFCTKFQVPPPSTGSSEVATVRFQAQGDVDIMETKNVVIQRIDDAVVVQTDKATYKPGETVRFRIVTLDDNFLCMKIKYYVVELKDPNNNRIAQWKDIDAKMCIADLSFNLTSDPMLGVYTISVENSQTLQTFIVEEQVLPRYEVTIEEPSKLFVTQSTFPLKVCARYTYGKGVQGTVNVRLCRGTIYWFYFWDRMPCTTVKGETDATGCLTTKVNATLLELSEVTMNFYTVEVSADFIEKATDIPFTVKKSVSVSVDSVAITYEEMDTYYRRGQPFRIIMLVKDQNGSPLPFESVILNIYYGDNGFMKKDGLTGNDGRVTFTLETSQWSETVYIRPNIKDVDLSQTEVLPFYTEANSFLRFEPIREVIPCEGNVEVRVEYSLDQQDLSKGTKSVALYYVVIGKGGILVHGVKSINLVALQGHLSIGIHFQPKFGTAPKMLGFLILQNGTVVADRINFKMGMCFPNQASLKFARQTASPKSQISLHLFSSVGSMCALRAVDKSVQINQESNELTPEKVFGLFPYSVRGGYPSSVSEDLPDNCWGVFFPSFFSPLFQSQFADVFSLFKEIGVKILTNTQIAKPPVTEPCPLEMPFALPDKALPFQMLPSLTGSGSQNEVRKYFPDTWLWSLHKINGSHTTISVTVPDTITQFNARTFCIGDSGFGLSSEVSLTVFKPFFVDLLLPYSIVQGETLLLKALVFNYLKQCLKVHVNLLNSTDFSIQDCEDCLHTGCICADESEIFTWYIKANKIGSVPLTVKAEAINSVDPCRGHKVYVPPSGKLDILEKQLLVKPMGITKELTQNQFLCLNDSGETVKNLFPLTVPSSLVVGSESAYVAVMGDVLGSALQNLDGLIKMPYGCGEQNMLTMAPIVYVMDYLKATGQLSSSQSTQALLYLQSGYQRELNYKHIDGSYSAFGESDGEGSTWLTAFVMKCFYQAKNYIFIDDLVLNRAVMWLASRQKPDGCFTSSGRLFHTTMKGGVEDDLSLSTYITAALLERGTPGTTQQDPILNSSLSCIRASASSSSNPYTLALMAYTFALANDVKTKQMLLNKLYPLAASSDVDLYWPYTLQSSSSNDLSASVELTAYVLLALVTGSSPSKDDIQKASHIVTWLSKQQNPYGGFQSTQDTVVAIQALAKYTRVTFNPKASLSAMLFANEVYLKTFTVDQTNRLLLQKEPLPNIPGNYSMTVTGSGCVYIQVILKYNELPALEDSPFTIMAETSGCDLKGGLMTIIVTVSYQGRRPVTNMVLIEVEMLSGFRPHVDTEKSLLKYKFVEKVTSRRGSITIYLDKMDQSPHEYHILIEREVEVLDLKPANAKVYDYYQTEDNAATTYSPCPEINPA